MWNQAGSGYVIDRLKYVSRGSILPVASVVGCLLTAHHVIVKLNRIEVGHFFGARARLQHGEAEAVSRC